MDKSYKPEENEKRIYAKWEKDGYFTPKLKSGEKPFTVVIPPPNITGSLHMGHALNNTIQDVMVRWNRMRGIPSEWLPGTDHAGIATQSVVEKKLAKEGKTRFDLGRANFEKEVWKWKDEYEARILGQLKTLGCSCDWSRTRFTMDEGYTKAILNAFTHYYEKGYIYRDYRITNWCPRCGTSLSDLEVEHEEHESFLWYIKYEVEGGGELTVATTRPETMLGDTAVAVNPKDKRFKDIIGKNVILPIQSRKIPVIADSVVDMEFGTGAVKVTPAHDPNDFEIAKRHKLDKIIVIDLEGKMTPEAGEQFAGLDRFETRDVIIEMLKKGKWLSEAKPYVHNVGHCYRCNTVMEPSLTLQWYVSMKELAKPAIETVKNGEVEFHPKKWKRVYLDWMNNINDWCISRQIWWGHQIPVWYKDIPKYEELNSLLKGCKEVKVGDKDSPVHAKHTSEFRFSLNEEDLAWVKDSFKATDGDEYDYIDFFDTKTRTRVEGSTYTKTPKTTSGTGVVAKWGQGGQVENKKACLELRMTTGFARYEIEFKGGMPSYFKDRKVISSMDILKKADLSQEGTTIYVGSSSPEGKGWQQDPDVLDTWFSSALWPFATFGWPDRTKDLDYFYPTAFLATARDILYLWVARMIMSGIEFMGESPFKDVYINPTVFNHEGRRMSKSLGTGVDPLGLIEKYGTDATRFGLLWQIGQGQDIKFSEDAILNGKRFANKIWNATRFTLMNLEGYKNVSRETFEKEIKPNLTKSDKEMLNKLNATIEKTNKYLEKYDFQHAVEEIYDFFWHDFCDTCIEDTKVRIRENDKTKLAAQYTLDIVLKNSLKLLHPIMPFVTEAIWENLDEKKPLIISDWPTAVSF